MIQGNSANIATHLAKAAEAFPHEFAVFSPVGRDWRGRVCHTHYTFRQLEEESNILARGLAEVGIRPGMRVAFLVHPGLDFFAIAFALFKVGAVIVGVDPGMGPNNLDKCLVEAETEAFIGVTKAHVARRLFGWARKSIRIKIVVGPRRFLNWGMIDLQTIRRRGLEAAEREIHETTPDTTAALVFTSGSTGVPKAVVYTHGIFHEQAQLLAQSFRIQPRERELITFPHFAFFGPVWGATLVVADMDFLRPGSADPEKIAEAIVNFGVTGMFGSPALLNRLGRWGEETGTKLPSLRRVVSAGAPVPAHVLRRITGMLRPGVQVHTPYGATEALPVSSIGSDELLGETTAQTERGAGVCIGRPLGSLCVQIIKLTDEPIETWSDDLLAPAGQIGEIVVKGPVVTREYFQSPQSTRFAKIRDGSNELYHRMGDLGYLDDSGRLWFCGRKSQRVVTIERDYFTVPCEAVFNTHPNVFRTALVSVSSNGQTRPALCVELEGDGQAGHQAELRADLLEIGSKFEHTRGIRDILFHPAFPVDARHNAKIGREKLGQWAQQQLRSRR